MAYYVNGKEFASSALAKSYAGGGTTGGGYGAALQSLMTQTQAAEIKAREQQIGQAEKARTYLQQILDIYSAGGAYGKGMEMVLGAQKRQDVSRAEQTDISSGLYGIRSRGAEWESTVGAKARATLEDVRLGRRAQALGGLAQFEAGIEYEQPDYSTLMEAIAAGAGMPSGGGITDYKPMESLADAYPYGYPGGTTGAATETTGVTGGSAYGSALAAGETAKSGIEMGAGMGPMFEGGGTSKTIYWHGVGSPPNNEYTKTISVAASALGSGPGGFKNEKEYKAYMPSGYSTRPRASSTVTGGGGTFTGAGYTGTY